MTTILTTIEVTPEVRRTKKQVSLTVPELQMRVRGKDDADAVEALVREIEARLGENPDLLIDVPTTYELNLRV